MWKSALRRAALWDEVKDKLAANGLSLSGGQQQRLCIARTVAVKPEVILFDEPCSALDPISTSKIEELIDELKQDYTIVIVTHNMQQAARVSEFTAFMYLGSLVEFGRDPNDIHLPQRPAHAGLHHWPLRLTQQPSRGTRHERSYRQVPFDQELLLLDKKVAQMGGLSERLVAQGFNSLEKRDPKLGESAVASDRAIDQLERELQEQSIQMIARRQPMANDLRHIMTVLKIAGDLERIGDLGKNTAKRALAVSGENHPKSLMTGLKHMTELALRQLTDVLDAYAERDADKALGVWRHDEQIDAMYNSLFRELLTYMMEDPRNIGLCTHLLFGAKNIERIGDHTTNIAENVYYLVHGTALTDDRPKGDDTSSTLISRD